MKVMDMDGITENDNSVNLFLSSVYKTSSAFVLVKPVHLSLLKTMGIFYRTIDGESLQRKSILGLLSTLLIQYLFGGNKCWTIYRSSHLVIFSYCNDMMKVLFYNQGSLSCILHLHYYNYMLPTTGIMYAVIACQPQQFVYIVMLMCLALVEICYFVVDS